jgi:nucleotide-binding universal stress UspA family protein
MDSYIINKVLVPIDFSPVSLNALETAIAICKRQLATLTLIHVVENTYVLFPPEAGELQEQFCLIS